MMMVAISLVIGLIVIVGVSVWMMRDLDDGSYQEHYTYEKYYGIPLEKDNKKSSSYYYEEKKF
jgi:hypothetical protein